ncbi:MAG: helix-turn-helix transcriptional regulator [Clostridia bacterium]|nr:helix-turn-helix transcriptional regulator [Clostridia bacterium]
MLAVSYNKLWKLLIDRKMTRAELRRRISISPNTMTKLIHDREVSLSVIARICEVLGTDVGSIMEFIHENTDKVTAGRGIKDRA